MEIITEITQNFLFGFGLYTILRFIISPFLSETVKSRSVQYDNLACVLVPWIALVFIVLFAFEVWFSLQIINNERVLADYKERALGIGWLPFWHQAIFYSMGCLLWIKQLRRKIWVRVLISFFLMFSIHTSILFVTSLERDYLQASWSLSISEHLLHWLNCLILFSAITIGFQLILNYINLLRNKG